MLKQIRDLCLFMICGQTLLYFQSGKKYEKICRMILELLVLAGIVGMILNFLQSLGFRKGEMEAAGGAVAGMQQSMEEALSRQLGAEAFQENFLLDDAFGSLLEKYTMSEIKTRYNNFAEQYGLEIQEIKQNGEKIQVLLKVTDGKKQNDEENPSGAVEIEQIEIEEIAWGEGEKNDKDMEEEEDFESPGIGEEELDAFRRQLALMFMMEEEELEVVLIDG